MFVPSSYFPSFWIFWKYFRIFQLTSAMKLEEILFGSSFVLQFLLLLLTDTSHHHFLHAIFGRYSPFVILIVMLIIIGDRFEFSAVEIITFIESSFLSILDSNSVAEVETENWFRSNQLNTQTNMMADFCYTNPTIVPGELLSRRGFSMYSGADNFDNDFGKNKNGHCGMYHEARSKFWSKFKSEMSDFVSLVQFIWANWSIIKLNRD